MTRSKFRSVLFTTAVFATLSVGATGCIIRTGSSTGAQTSFQVLNESAETICYVHISPSSDSQWGPDRLGPSETIAPGTSRSWGLPTGNYNFRMLDCDRQRLMERRGVGIGGSGVSVSFRVRE